MEEVTTREWPKDGAETERIEMRVSGASFLGLAKHRQIKTSTKRGSTEARPPDVTPNWVRE